MPVLLLIFSTICLLVWHGSAAYPWCSDTEKIKTREDAIAYTIKIWTERKNPSVKSDPSDEMFSAMIENEDFRRISSERWFVHQKDILLYNKAWYVRYWDFDQHTSVIGEFDTCRRPIDEDYYELSDILRQYF